MKPSRPAPQAAIVIKWPQTAAAGVARLAAQRLAAGAVPATWAIDQASQLESLRSWGALPGAADATLLACCGVLADAAVSEIAAREMGRRLELLRDAGLGVEVLYAGAKGLGEHWPRALRALGVCGIVVDGEPSPAAPRALPFGVWRFSSHVTIPRRPSWTSWLRTKRPLLTNPGHPAVVATIDLARVESEQSAAAAAMQRALDEAAAARADRSVALVTMSQLAAQFTRANAPRPQRSILRAA
jgi:hypothetical protein